MQEYEQLAEILSEIKEHDLTADESITDHDEMIIAQATKLMQIGYLEYEVAAYATAYEENGEIYYYISEREATIENFAKMCMLKDIYTVPIKYYFKRYDLLNATVESLKERFCVETAQKLQKAYPPIFFEALRELTASVSENIAYPLLVEMSEQLDSCFDMNQLQLFERLLEMLLEGRQLSLEGYTLLQQWLEKEYEKIAVEPVASGGYRRTYSGFAYRKNNGEIKYFCDAYPYLTKEKQTMFLSQGFVVTPILSNVVYGDSIATLDEAKAVFLGKLRHYLNETYFKLMQHLRTLPPTVSVEGFGSYMAQLKEARQKQAVEALRYYGRLWNVPEEFLK